MATPGNIGPLPPSFFGIGGLGEALQQFGQMRQERKDKKEDDARREQQQNFENLLRIDRDAATRYYNTVIQPGGDAKHQLTAQEFTDQELVRAMEARQRGEELQPYQRDLYNTQVLGTLTPELDRLFKENQVAGRQYENEAQRLYNEGIPEQQRQVRLQNYALELQTQDAERQQVQRKALDESIAADTSNPYENLFEMETFSNLDSVAANTALTWAQRNLVMAQTASERRRAMQYAQEIQQAAQSDPEFAAVLESIGPDMETLGRLVRGRVPAQVVAKYILNPSDPIISDEQRTLLDEAATTAADASRAMFEKTVREADPAQSQNIFVLQNAEYFPPDLVAAAATGLLKTQYGDAVTLERVSGWFGFGEHFEPSIQGQALLDAVNGSGVPEQVDVTSLVTDLVNQFGQESVIADARAALQDPDMPADRKQLAQQVLDQLGTGAALPPDTISQDRQAPSFEQMIRSDPAFTARIAGLPADVRASAQLLRQQYLRESAQAQEGSTTDNSPEIVAGQNIVRRAVARGRATQAQNAANRALERLQNLLRERN